jgi:hypothetical protein
MSDGDDSAALWKVNRTIHELVKDRGYQVADEEINMSLADFKAQYANNGGTVEWAAPMPFFRRVVDQRFHFAVGISSIFSPMHARIPPTRYSYSFLMKRASV